MKYLKSYNESFSNESFGSESELKEALEIYAEELPFEIHDLNIMKISIYDYRITYVHVDAKLNNRIAALPYGTTRSLDIVSDEDSEDDDSIEKIEDEVGEIASVAFTKFARKYDMTCSSVFVTTIDEDPNREFDNDIIVEFLLDDSSTYGLTEKKLNESVNNLTGPEFEELVQLHLENPRINDKFEVIDVTFQSVSDYINTDGSTGTYKLDKFGRFYMSLKGMIDVDPKVSKSPNFWSRVGGENIKKIITPILNKIARMYDVEVENVTITHLKILIDASYEFEIKFAVVLPAILD